MTSTCAFRDSGSVEALFYDDLPSVDRRAVEAHLRECAGCRAALDDLAIIRDALAARPIVAAPPAGDWNGFMRRLDARLAHEGRDPSPAWSVRSLLAAAAMLALVTLGLLVALRATQDGSSGQTTAADASATPRLTSSGAPAPGGATSATTTPGIPAPAAGDEQDDTDFAALTGDHFERSKLVVLGLAAKDPARRPGPDWGYERALAEELLSDTRLYRLAAEDRGLGSIAAVMGDLELVLLQASFTDDTDPASLAHIQRLIRRRDLVEKMDAVGSSGL